MSEICNIGNSATSVLLAYPAPTPAQSADFFLAKLHYHADAWDVAEDLRARVADIVVIDTRSEALYAAGHVPGAIGIPHRLMDEASTAQLDRSKTYVTYCDGIGCNGSTKGAYKLARLGFKVKEMLGGLDFWIRDGWPVATGAEVGEMPAEGQAIECGCA
ncbi:rhodanese-like domain-containing protein [Roseateles oligotrophus]|uniref:Rhodanese-like domain-containing protein n=1 Tax=Roseateles oligotrophus TaxID=1769250 RepID=A0ABT2YIB8_9BURK|nr:rhodanese-like domain-containing protein [Roseateles oligotrophus]MCV2369747.1 rhodanese-like domain-containing protein [Roseateles oligotrophus]